MEQKLRLIGIFFLGIILLAIAGCGPKEKTKIIESEQKEQIKIAPFRGEYINIAVGAMITPREGFAYYKKLFNYIGKKTGRSVGFVSKDSYAEVNALLESGNVDIGFVCSPPYVQGKEKFGLELMVVPQAFGVTTYYSYIIAPLDSPAKGLNDLRGKTFAFGDPQSNSGTIAPNYMLYMMNETPDSFFGKHIYTYAHDKTIKAVAQKIVDGGAVDSLVWEYLNARSPEYTSGTKIIDKSLPCGIPPVVVRPGFDPVLKEKIRGILLTIHENEEGREILKGLGLDKFVIEEDKHYDFIRQELKALSERAD